MELKRTKVIILPTKIDEKLRVSIYKHSETNRITKGFMNSRSSKDIPQHLYFITDEPIKVGDCTLDLNQLVHGHGGITTIDNKIELERYANNPKHKVRKVVGTTDPKLKLDGYGVKSGFWYLPSPSQSFVEKYCKKGGIDEVLIETMSLGEWYDANVQGHLECQVCEDWIESGVTPKCKCGYKIKLKQDNTFITHPLKDSWTKEIGRAHV